MCADVVFFFLSSLSLHSFELYTHCSPFLFSTFLLLSLSSPSSLAASQHELDAPVEDIQWADLQNVFILTRAGTLFHSDNGGKTFTNQMTNM